MKEIGKVVAVIGGVVGAIELSRWAFSQKTKQAIRERQRFCCADCGQKTHLEIHHIVPYSMGGSDHEENGVGLCHLDHKKWDELAREGIIYPGIPIENAKEKQIRKKSLWKNRHK